MSFTNRIRLPFYLTQPQFPVDEEIYLKANGKRRVLKSITAKEYQAKTDYLPQKLHERLVVALRHDNVTVEGTKVSEGVRINGSYDIDWPDFLDFPIAPAKFKALVEGFSARNTRCDVCTTVDQITANGDTIGGTLQCGNTYIYDPTTNDSICCDNPVFSLVSWNSGYIDTISIDPNTGIVTFTLKDGFDDLVNVTLFTYQISCGDEVKTATVRGRINCEGGGASPCLDPQNVEITWTDNGGGFFTMDALWDAPVGGEPACGYRWQVTEMLDDMSEIPVAFGNTSGHSASVSSLQFGHHYRFCVLSDCCDSNISSYICQDFAPASGGGGNDHLDPNNYSCVCGDIEAPCTMVNGSITRTAGAAAAALAANQCVRVHVRWGADTGCNVFEYYDFHPTSGNIIGITVDLSCLGACGELNCEVISVELIPC